MILYAMDTVFGFTQSLEGYGQNIFFNGLQVIISEASKTLQGVSKFLKPSSIATEGETQGRMVSLSEAPANLRSPSKSLKVFMESFISIPLN